MSRRRRVCEGRGKVLYESPEPGTLVQHFKDDSRTLGNRCAIAGKGVRNNCISEFLMLKLTEIGVPTHFQAPKTMQ
jgi:phosphoribosylaminoimidazole-succinocarboxamide synthase